MVQRSEGIAQEWERLPEGSVIQMDEAMNDLTLEIAAKTFFRRGPGLWKLKVCERVLQYSLRPQSGKWANRELLVPQSHHGIETAGADGRDIPGGAGDDGQRRGGKNQRDRIVRG
jgi:hypothetical protein